MTQQTRQAPAQAVALHSVAEPDEAHAEARELAERGVRVRFDAILARCAKRHGIGVDELLHGGRCRTLIAARWEAIHLVARAFPRFSSTQLGELFGRDNTTILHALGRTARSRKGKGA